jgi:predicted anti-sigma-YlaC factor YlaD
MKLTKNKLKSMIRMIKMTLDQEIGCEDCYDQLNQFAEMELENKSPEKALPRVKEHLERCGNCRQEYEALLEAIEASAELTE